MKDFKKLKVWNESHNLTLSIYKLTNELPKEEKFGLISQMRRASASIPTNISEGCGQSTDPQFARYIDIAIGSTCELDYLTMLVSDLKYIDQNKFKVLSDKINQIRRMLYALRKKLKA